MSSSTSRPGAIPRILLVGGLDPQAEGRLESAADVVRPPSVNETTLCRLVADCDALVVRTHIPVTAAILSAGRRLRVVGVAGVGLDRVDVETARRLGIAVLNRPLAASDAVAEFTVALMLQMLRPIPRLAESYRSGAFTEARRHPHGRELRDLTVGIVGMGRIGSRVGRLCAAGFGARVLYNDIVTVGPFAYPAEPVDKAAIWTRCDIVTLHVPLTDQTRGLVNADVFRRMKPDALLVNTARGAVVVTEDLVEALQTGRIGGSALDVTDPEPLPTGHPLFRCENCLLTPHVAARTVGGLRRMHDVVEDVLAYLQMEEPRNPG